MFNHLNNIIFIDMSKFDSSKVTTMLAMFEACTSLTSINFGNFNTENVRDMGAMFNMCPQLISLDLSSFNTLSVNYMEQIFYGSSALKKINIYNFDTSFVTKSNKMFYSVNNITICIKNISKISNIISNDLSEFPSRYKLECLYECPELEQCKHCSNETLALNLCTFCEEGYFPVYVYDYLYSIDL